MKKSYEQLEEMIRRGELTKKDAVDIMPHVEILGTNVLRARGIVPEKGENYQKATRKILKALRKLILGQKSK